MLCGIAIAGLDSDLRQGMSEENGSVVVKKNQCFFLQKTLSSSSALDVRTLMFSGFEDSPNNCGFPFDLSEFGAKNFRRIRERFFAESNTHQMPVSETKNGISGELQ